MRNGFDSLYHFISPVTGRVLCDRNYILLGDKEGRATPSPILIDLLADFVNLNKVVNSIINGTIIIPIDSLPDLQYRHIWLGDINNRPEVTGLGFQELFTGNNAGDIITTIILDLNNMANLPFRRLWLGDAGDRPVPTGLFENELFVGSPANNGDIITTVALDIDNLPNLGPAEIWIGCSPPLTPFPCLLNRPVPVSIIDLIMSILTGTPSQITVTEVPMFTTATVNLKLADDTIIPNSVQAGNLKMGTSIQSMSANSNITLSPNGTGLVDMTTRRVINVSDPINNLDVVNLQTLKTYVGGAGTVTSVTGTANQITVVNPTTTPVLSMPADVIVSNSVRGGNIRIGNTNNIESINANGNINVLPNGTGLVGVGTSSPAYLLDVNGTARAKRLLGNGNVPTVVLGATGVVGTGATFVITGTELSGIFSLTTGAALLLGAGVAATFTLTSAMPSSSFCVSFTPRNGNSAGRNIFATSISSTQFTVNITGISLLSAATTYQWNYNITGY